MEQFIQNMLIGIRQWVYEKIADVNEAIGNKQDVLTAGANIEITSGSTISATDTTYVASDFDIKDLADSTGLREEWSGKQDALTAGANIEITSAGTISVTGITEQDLLVETTYSELKSLRDNGELVPGQLYRITDYVATTTQEGTISAGHAFDIIVTALSDSDLSEEAKAIAHSGDTYFANCELSAWELKYCLDNDTSRFAWADTGSTGKGVIYHLKDDLGNECAYDFKNIMFELQKVTGITWSQSFTGNTDFTESAEELYIGKYLGSWFTMNDAGTVEFDTADTKYFYTFSLCTDGETFNVDDSETVVDGSMRINTSDAANIYRQNVIPELIEPDGDNLQSLNYIVFKPMTDESDDCCGNVFGKNNKQMTIGYSWSVYNRFGSNCFSNSFGNSCNRNSFGNTCLCNSFGNECTYNSFGNYCQYNTFGNGCSLNTFGNDCSYNSFGNNCGSNSFGNSCRSNSFGIECYSNSFGNSCQHNRFGNDCGSNSFGNECLRNSFGNEFSKNTLGIDIQYLDFTVNYGGTSVTYIQILDGYKYSQLTAVPTGIADNTVYSQTIGFNSAGSFVVKNMLD